MYDEGMTTRAPLIDIVAWNCYVANSGENVKDFLAEQAAKFSPDVFALSEARTHADAIHEFARDFGYVPFQRPPVPQGKTGLVNDAGDSALLVRKTPEIEILSHRKAKMRRKWKVASKDRVHTPREYETATLRVRGRKIKVRASHFPTLGFKGPNRWAFLESYAKAKAWALATGRNTATADIGDFNETRTTMAKRLGKRFLVGGSGIDLILTTDVDHIDSTELGKGGGDHNGRRYVLR